MLMRQSDPQGAFDEGFTDHQSVICCTVAREEMP
jgi:hypothetical protein